MKTKTKTKDNINPSHYRSHPSGVECITITRHFNFNKGNAIKYIWRAGEKNSKTEVEDLRKAVWYINDEIKRIENYEPKDTNNKKSWQSQESILKKLMREGLLKAKKKSRKKEIIYN